MDTFLGMISKGFQFIRKNVDKMTTFVVSILNIVLLMIVYIVGIGLVSLILKITGKHFLPPSNKKSTTYWINKEKKEIIKKDFYRQY